MKWLLKGFVILAGVTITVLLGQWCGVHTHHEITWLTLPLDVEQSILLTTKGMGWYALGIIVSKI